MNRLLRDDPENDKLNDRLQQVSCVRSIIAYAVVEI